VLLMTGIIILCFVYAKEVEYMHLCVCVCNMTFFMQLLDTGCVSILFIQCRYINFFGIK